MVMDVCKEVFHHPDTAVLRSFDVAEEIARRVASRLSLPVPSLRVEVAQLADALPVDEEADRMMARALSERSAKSEHRKLSLPVLSEGERCVLASLRADAQEPVPEHDDCQSCDNRRQTIALLDRLLGRKS